MLSWLQQHNEFSIEGSLFCLDHTGMYNFHWLQFFSKQGASVWVENPIQIKRSLGLQRDKNDKVDAVRMAQYACPAWETGRRSKILLQKEVEEGKKQNECS